MGCSVTGTKPKVRGGLRGHTRGRFFQVADASPCPYYLTLSVVRGGLPFGIGIAPLSSTRMSSLMQTGDTPLALPPKAESSTAMNTNPAWFLVRLLLGTLAGFYYFVLPIYMFMKNLIWPKDAPGF